MKPFRYTLVADGPSDRCLLPIIDHVIGRVPAIASAGFVAAFAELSVLADRERGLTGKIRLAAELYPCDVLFVHRDAEREPAATRLKEISAAAGEAKLVNAVGVVPVRMTEAWLLINETAIRRAADNPNGSVRLSLPRLWDLEAVANPKQVLYDLLVRASEKSGRRLAQFRTKQNLGYRRARVAALIPDFSPLDRLAAFRTFRDEALTKLREWSSATHRER